MHFLSTFLAGRFLLMTGKRKPAEPDESTEGLDDFCVFCGRGLAEHDHYCRRCGGIRNMVSMRGLVEALRSEPEVAEPAPPSNDDREEVPAILQACGVRGLSKVQACLPGAVNETNSLGETPLMWAVRLGRQNLIELLLDSGADPDIRTRDAPNGLRLREGFWTERERAPGQTALIWAIEGGNEKIVRMLLSRGADPHLADDWGQTPLLWAARAGNEQAARRLIAAGADLNRADDMGRTPLLAAAEGGHAALLTLLREAGADPRRAVSDEFGGFTLLHLAALSDREEVVIAAARDNPMDLFDAHQVTPLTAAIAERRFRSARQLIALGADVNARGAPAAPTPLWGACWLAGADDSLAMVDALLSAGADPTRPGLFNEPPLHKAVSNGYWAVVRRLISAGADVRAKCPDGTTLLMVAAEMDHVVFLESLLAEGADVNDRQKDGMTALMYARTPAVVRLLVEAGAEVNAQTEQGETALMFLEDHQLDAAQVLLELGADPSLRTDYEMTALDIANNRGRPKLADLLRSLESTGEPGA